MSTDAAADPGTSTPGSTFVHAKEGAVPTTWFNGDIYQIKLLSSQTGGLLSLTDATVPPGGGPAPHIHPHADETFYVVSGDLEFLNGHETFHARTGDIVHIPRGTVHRFYNPGLQPARMVFVYTPGGPEQLFVEGGDDPQPGVQVQPWGPERIDERLLGLLDQYGTQLPPASS